MFIFCLSLLTCAAQRASFQPTIPAAGATPDEYWTGGFIQALLSSSCPPWASDMSPGKNGGCQRDSINLAVRYLRPVNRCKEGGICDGGAEYTSCVNFNKNMWYPDYGKSGFCINPAPQGGGDHNLAYVEKVNAVNPSTDQYFLAAIQWAQTDSPARWMCDSFCKHCDKSSEYCPDTATSPIASGEHGNCDCFCREGTEAAHFDRCTTFTRSICENEYCGGNGVATFTPTNGNDEGTCSCACNSGYYGRNCELKHGDACDINDCNHRTYWSNPGTDFGGTRPSCTCSCGSGKFNFVAGDTCADWVWNQRSGTSISTSTNFTIQRQDAGRCWGGCKDPAFENEECVCSGPTGNWCARFYSGGNGCIGDTNVIRGPAKYIDNSYGLECRQEDSGKSYCRQTNPPPNPEDVEGVVASGSTSGCEAQGHVRIISENDCRRACESVGSSHFQVGTWDFAPGCFKAVSGQFAGNCHWNRNSDKPWNQADIRPVCKSTDASDSSENLNPTDPDDTPDVNDPDDTPDVNDSDNTSDVNDPDDTPDVNNPDDTPDVNDPDDTPDVNDPDVESDDTSDDNDPNIESGDSSIDINAQGAACQQLCSMDNAGKCLGNGDARRDGDQATPKCKINFAWSKDGGFTPCSLNRKGVCHKNVNRSWKCFAFGQDLDALKAACASCKGSWCTNYGPNLYCENQGETCDKFPQDYGLPCANLGQACVCTGQVRLGDFRTYTEWVNVQDSIQCARGAFGGYVNNFQESVDDSTISNPQCFCKGSVGSSPDIGDGNSSGDSGNDGNSDGGNGDSSGDSESDANSDDNNGSSNSDDTDVKSFGVASNAFSSCEAQGHVTITSENDCRSACQSVASSNFQVGNWGFSPGCSKAVSGRWAGNCHWNRNANGPWNQGDIRPLCQLSVSTDADSTPDASDSNAESDNTPDASDLNAGSDNAPDATDSNAESDNTPDASDSNAGSDNAPDASDSNVFTNAPTMTPAEVNMCGAGQPSSDHGSCRTSWRGRMCQGGCNNNRRRPHRFACNRRMSEQECKCQGPGVKARYCPSSSEDQASDQVLISSIFEDHLYIKILSFIGVLTIAYALLRFKAALKSDYKEIPEPIPADF